MDKHTDEKRAPKRFASAGDHLANERTFLAWIRTSIALMGFGFVIVKFSLFARQVSMLMAEGSTIAPAKGYSAMIGVIMVAIGAVSSVLAYFRYRNIERQLNNGNYYPSRWLSVFVTLAIITASVLLITYLLSSV